MPKLGVNIDHVATLRQARKGKEPDPLLAVTLCEQAGAHGIVAHLREDRRHINDADIRSIRRTVKTQFNMEMSLNPGIVKVALDVKPDIATLVPERRQEVTTEGGLDIIRHASRVSRVNDALKKRGVRVSLFIDPIKAQILQVKKIGADTIELHTGQYASARNKQLMIREHNRLNDMTQFAHHLGLRVSAGHGLNYTNTRAIAQINNIEELNIGHSIISRAVTVGLKKAVEEMLALAKG